MSTLASELQEDGQNDGLGQTMVEVEKGVARDGRRRDDHDESLYTSAGLNDTANVHSRKED